MNLTHDNTIHNWPIRRNSDAPRGYRAVVFTADGSVRRGFRAAGSSILGLFIFGIPFVGAGIFIIIAGTGNFEVAPSTVHAPSPILTLIGTLFASAGLILWGMVLYLLLGEGRRAAMLATHQSAAISDYPWDIRGYTPSRLEPVWYGIWALFLTAFSAVFFYTGLEPGTPLWVQLTGALIGLLALWGWYDTGVRILKTIKFGSSRIVFDNFPYQLNKPVIIKWVPPPALTQAHSGSFTLRCVEEFYESLGNTDSVLVHNELWHDTWLLDRAQSFHPGEDITIRYEPPQGLPSTALSGDRTIFWEFEIKLKMPGPDFEATYLVPVYGE